MTNFEDFLSEGKKLQIKRKYTENHPAQTVGKTANVRNAVLQAIKDGVVTREEFSKILSELSTSANQWASRNRKYFNVSEEGVKLSKWGRRILAELDETPKAAEVFEATVEMDAINPDDKDFLKFLKKNKVKIINKEMDGPGGGHPVITMQGKRKDLEKVLADSELGWDDPDLAEYIEESVVNEKIKITKDEWPYIEFKDGGKKHKVEFDYEDIIDDHGNEGQDQYWIGKDEDGQEWSIDVYADYRGEVQDVLYDTIVKESVTEARFVKDFNKDVLDAKTKDEVLKLYPKAEFFIGKSDHFFGELDANLFFKAYYTKGQKEFKIKSIYSEKGNNYVHLYNESVVTEGKGFKNTEDFEAFLKEIDSMPEAQIKKIMGKDYIDTPGFYEDEKDDYADVTDFMMSNMGRKEFQKLQDWWETNVAESVVTENYEVIYSDGVSAMKKFRNEKQALDFMKKTIASNKKLRDIAVYKPGMHSTTQTELVVKFWGDGSYLDNVSKRDKDLADKKLQENTDMKNEINLFESFSDFVGANFLNEAIKSSILRTVLSNGREGKEAKKNLSQLAKGFYNLSKVALDKIEDEDFIVSNDVSKVFKNYGGSSHVLFFISDNEKENPYYDHNNGSWNDYKIVPGGGIILAAMSGDRQFYANEWSRWSGGRAWSKNKKGDADQIGINHKYRGWGASGLNNGKRIAEMSDRVIVINLELIRQKYSTENLRNARAEAKAGATAFKSDKDFRDANRNRYHKILADKAASLPLDKMVSDAIDKLAKQISDGLTKGEKTRYQEIKIGESPKGKEVKAKDASQHMSNILDDYARYVDYIRQAEESEARYGERESYYERESKNYAKSIKERINKIDSFDYAW